MGPAKMQCLCEQGFVLVEFDGMDIHGGIEESQHVHENTADKDHGTAFRIHQLKQPVDFFMGFIEIQLLQMEGKFIKNLIRIGGAAVTFTGGA